MKKRRNSALFLIIFVITLTACSNKPGISVPTNIPTSAPTEAAPTLAPTEALAAATPTPAPTEALAEATPTPAPTDAPVAATATPAPTDAPVAATATPAPTKAPVETTPTATPFPKAPLDKGDLRYTFNDMDVLYSDGVDYTIHNDGSLEIKYNKYFSQIRFLLPESIDLAECIGLTINMDAEDTYIDIGFFGKEILTNPYCKETDVRWGFPVDGQHDYQCFPPSPKEMYGISFLVGAETDDYSGYKFTINSIIFHMASGSTTSIPTDIAPDVTEDMTLLNTYGTVFENMGAMVVLEQLENPATLKEIKKQFNSVTMGWQLDNPFPDPVTFISVEEAKRLGYSIPADYPDDIVPKFDFTNWDKVLKICAENGLRLRGQASTCNGQIPKWFFSEGYQESGAYVTPEEMNARNEFYIRTIMEHVYNSEYGYLVYSWDLINEYYNTSGTDWVELYGEYSLSPDNLKRLYEAAADVLVKHNIRDQVSLVLNGYNTYYVSDPVNMPETVLTIANYINSDTKALDAIGMETWMPSETSVAAYKNTMKMFLDAGYEIQITEMDVPLTELTDQQRANQAKIYGEVLKEILKLKRSGANISVISFHAGIDVSPIPPEESAVIFLHFGRPRDCYYAILQSYAETINTPAYTLPQISSNGDLTYTSRDLDHLKLENYADEPKFTILPNGALEIPFTFQYQGIRFGFPEGVDMGKCTGITVEIETGSSEFAVELLSEKTLFEHWTEPLYSDYGCHGEGIYRYTITPDITDNVHGISLMILNEVDKGSDNKATLYSVTFHMQQ